ncbi:hypothetical protein [Leifsonia sp. EB41]|uniref:hypothetical protein n=1 Tax=Leifsonia sp. EB41 TaxID=3156260 RepID=UPI0035144037
MAASSRLTLAAQALALRSAFPSTKPVLRNGRLIWEHVLQPAAASDTYGVRLEARPCMQAEIFVTSPALRPDTQGRLPHVYKNGSLCLNRAKDWRADQLFINTTIPWAIEWLFFYELWLVDRIWRGDGLDENDLEGQQGILHPYSPRAARPRR